MGKEMRHVPRDMREIAGRQAEMGGRCREKGERERRRREWGRVDEGKRRGRVQEEGGDSKRSIKEEIKKNGVGGGRKEKQYLASIPAMSQTNGYTKE